MTSTNYISWDIVHVFWIWVSVLLPGSWRPVLMPTRLFKGISGRTILGTAFYGQGSSYTGQVLPSRLLTPQGAASLGEDLNLWGDRWDHCQEVLAHLPLTAGESPFPVLGEAEEDSSTKPNPSHQPQPTPPSNWTWKHLVKTTSYLRLEKRMSGTISWLNKSA